MNARKLIGIGCGLVIAVFLAGCLILGFGILGITGQQEPPPVSLGDAGSSAGQARPGRRVRDDRVAVAGYC